MSRYSEKDLWRFIKESMGAHWDAQRHEDKDSLGIPDVSYGLQDRQGWIELKYVEKFPKRDTTPIKIPHFTPLQRNWLNKRYRYGKNVWVGLQIDNYFFMCPCNGNVYDIGHVWTEYEYYTMPDVLNINIETATPEEFRAWFMAVLLTDNLQSLK